MPPRLPFDRVANVYDETRRVPPKLLAQVVTILLEQLRGKRVLEIGVGTGRFAVPLQKSGVELVGLDISRTMVNRGIAKGMRNAIFADGARLPFAARSFDLATTNHTLHLIPDWRDVLLEMARVTRETYFTLIERTDEKRSIRREYDELVREEGHGWTAPGIHERELPSFLTPDLVMPVGPFQDRVPADKILAELDDREYSSQWEVPEEIHRRAMGTLRERWGGQEVIWNRTIEVTFWRVDRLAELARRVHQRV